MFITLLMDFLRACALIALAAVAGLAAAAAALGLMTLINGGMK